MQDGVYLGLPHADYLAAPDRLGSTDLVRLFSRGPGWWWGSRYNPHHVDKTTDAQMFGTALHTLLLEGRAAYEARFAVKPNPRDFPDLLTTSEELRSALEASDGAANVKAKTPKGELVQLAKAYLPGRHIWDDIVERWARTAKGRDHLASGEAFALDAMHAAALADPDMAEVCEAHGGVKLVEVSVFYTDARGLRKRYRFDSLLPTANVDLKSIADWRARPFEQSCAARIAEDHLNIQLAMSHEARLAAYEHIAAGRVFAPYADTFYQCDGAPEARAAGGRADLDLEAVGQPWADQVRWLRRFPTEAPLRGEGGPGWCWLWLFYQKPESGAAPSLLPLRVLWGDELHVNGWRKMRVAEDCYVENVARFGLNKPWTQVRQIHDTHHAAGRRVEVRDWDAPLQQPGESEAMSWRK